MSIRTGPLKKKKASRSLPKAGLKEKLLLYGSGVFLVALFIGIQLSSIRSSHPNSARTVPPFYESAEAAAPLPATLAPTQFTKPSVAQAYESAQRIPEVLAQQPCYCWCDRYGHRSLLDCYRSRHAENCDICNKEALLAGRMNQAGSSVQDIRSAIIRGEWQNTGRKDDAAQ